MSFDTAPSAHRQRSYNSGYMAAGKKAEEVVLQWLQTRPWVLGLEDLRSLRVMQEADCDCSISLTDGRVTIGEIKSDRHLGVSSNFLFEVLRINHTAPPDRAVTLGWSARTPARVILYYAPSVNKIYVIQTDDFRRAAQKYTADSRRGTRIDYVETDKIKSTINILIPAKYVTAQSYDLDSAEDASA
jgi:hypothetical protein